MDVPRTSFEKAMAIKQLGRVPTGTACIVRGVNDSILLLKRKGAHGAGTWSVPGGWVEAGEMMLGEAVRVCATRGETHGVYASCTRRH